MRGHGSGSPVVIQRKPGQRSQGADCLPGVSATIQLVAAGMQMAQAAEAAQPGRQARQPVAAEVCSLCGAGWSGGRVFSMLACVMRSAPPLHVGMREGRSCCFRALLPRGPKTHADASGVVASAHVHTSGARSRLHEISYLFDGMM